MATINDPLLRFVKIEIDQKKLESALPSVSKKMMREVVRTIRNHIQIGLDASLEEVIEDVEGVSKE